jgi:hypothetical protein
MVDGMLEWPGHTLPAVDAERLAISPSTKCRRIPKMASHSGASAVRGDWLELVQAASADTLPFCAFHAPARRWCLTPALTGTALAARSWEDKRLEMTSARWITYRAVSGVECSG